MITLGVTTERHGTWKVEVDINDEVEAIKAAKSVLYADHQISDIKEIKVLKISYT